MKLNGMNWVVLKVNKIFPPTFPYTLYNDFRYSGWPYVEYMGRFHTILILTPFETI